MTADDKPRRPVSDDERALWRNFTRAIKPLRRGPKVAETAGAALPNAKSQPTRPAAPLPAPRPVRRPAAKPKEPALAPLDRRARTQLARGTKAIDARLDLHGQTQSQAHAALLRFLRAAQSDGVRTALVITGKGSPDGERGVLRRQVPLWLALPEFRTLVVGFSAAAITHGGHGALYVRVRRTRSER